jgi:DNA-directed RNA polymerase specialized sigma24 family protein
MQHDDSVTIWLNRLKVGDEEAAQRLWDRYFARLILLARDKLRYGRYRGADQDEEDVALSALNSVYLGVVAGRFPSLDNRDDLWRLLVVVVARKALNQMRGRARLKRGGGRVRAETDLLLDDPDDALAQVVGQEPTPELAATFAEELKQRLDDLRDETLREVACMRLEGYANDEIAQRLNCTTRTVVRKVELIRRRWLVEASS